MAKPSLLARIKPHLSRPKALPGLVWKNVRFVFSNRHAKTRRDPKRGVNTGGFIDYRKLRPDAEAESLRKDAKVFAVMAATYGSDTNKLFHAIPKELEELYRQDLEEVLGAFTAYKSVLEVGAGNGIFTRLLDRWGCEGIVGTDISSDMLGVARAQLPQCRFELITKEAEPRLRTH